MKVLKKQYNMKTRTQQLRLLTLTIIGLILSTSFLYSIPQVAFDPNTTQEFRMRSGLPNFFAKVKKGEDIKVGFIGGSITAGNGDDKWSNKVYNWLVSQYSNSKFEKYNVAVPGTHAPFGAFRIGSKMLVHNPDLVFIEYRVNGLGFQGIRGPEGMVRQIRRNNPNTDICIVYTISQNMIEGIREGLQTSVGKEFERTANHYKIPSIDMGIEVVKLMDEDKLIFKSSTDVDGKIVFSKDGTHPLDAGAEIYKEVVIRHLQEMKENDIPISHSLPSPLDELSFEDVTIHTIDELNASTAWTKMDPNTNKIYRSARWRSEFVIGDALKCSQVGDSITFDWEGYLLALTTIPQGVGMAIEVTTDGGTSKEYTFEQQSSPRYGSHLFYLPYLDNGKHTTTVKITKLPNESTYYFGQYFSVK